MAEFTGYKKDLKDQNFNPIVNPEFFKVLDGLGYLYCLTTKNSIKNVLGCDWSFFMFR